MGHQTQLVGIQAAPPGIRWLHIIIAPHDGTTALDSNLFVAGGYLTRHDLDE
jgi:hypothetical protein